MRHFALAAATAISAIIATTSLAGDYAFRLHNHADGYTINGFYTYQEGQWSDNWLGGIRIRPGEYIDLDWFSDEGPCVVPFRVNWIDYGYDDFTIDWCQDVDNIYMENVGFSWD